MSAGSVGQVGIVVRDLEEAAERWSAGHDPAAAVWRVWTYGPATLSAQTYRGAAAAYSMRIALLGRGPQVELVEPVDGPSLYHEWLDQHGPGVQHLGFHVPSVATAIMAMEEAGFRLLQSGTGTGADGTGGFAYFDTQARLGFVAEAIEVPRRRREPEHVIALRTEEDSP
ncbi:VOC family protein [Phytoactinopolyspora alkaliphila]|uniref:VOC family protein n=2 Tax=Phytoactinopolyspora alkaliphila TaxID=1783498 RepID=A0A6N9YR73_9ACTN|nr:VOC family protein [Phytoactinopolyspora alkaliphila]